MKNSGWHDTYLGKIPIEWRYCSVADLIKDEIIERPIDGNHGEIHPKESDYVTEGIPFVMASDMEGGTIDFSTCKYISENQAAGLRKGFSLPGDVLLSHKATLGRTAIVPELDVPYIMLTPQVTYYRIKAKDKLSPQYLHWFFRSYKFQRALEAYGGAGSTRAYIGITEQQELPIVLPSPTEQVIIAQILSSLDEKIELNRKQNRTLEAIAQALFKRWFVEFEFPDENGRPYKSSGGAMQPSELGEIPVGWEVKLLSDVTIYLSRGITPAYVEEGGVMVLNQRCVRDGWINTEPARRHDVETRKIEGRELKAGDVLVNSTGMGTLGRVAQALALDSATVVDSHITVVRAEPSQVSSEYLGVCLRLKEREIEHMAEGSTGQTELSRAKLGELPVIVPDDGVLRLFTEVVADLNSKRALNWGESLSLTLARDTLLPKLMSGELRVA
jgi:type I restriction enzyme S subunit